MTAQPASQPNLEDIAASYVRSRPWPYRRYMASTGLPIHKGYYIESLKDVELGYWEERECKAAFLEMAGSEGLTETRVTEIAPGQTLPALKFALDEVVYVVEGNGLTTIWGSEDSERKTFEWQKFSMFLLPRGHNHQLTNVSGDKPVRLLHYNCLPLVMATVADPDFYFNNPNENQNRLSEGTGEFYSPAIAARIEDETLAFGVRDIWFGNFFPDMRAWDKLAAHTMRGVGASAVYVQYPGSEMAAHMSVFPARTYKKAHRHGPSFVIVIPTGDGYSIMWEEGKEKMVIPWKEGSLFVPPDRWFHQHFNVGESSARYLAFHPPVQFEGWADEIKDRLADQIEFPDEDPFVRQTFEAELAKRGLTTGMPEQVYTDKDYQIPS
jgi:oxalate decarboxylase/phosphoglucose isomerase-like protein (cupin superfamily)